MAKLTELNINSFRGIQQLALPKLSQVNLIVGDNNCGKTSILEAIQLFRSPTDVNNALRVARTRDYMAFSRLSIFDNFLSMLYGTENKHLELSCSYEEKSQTHFSQIKIDGNIKQIMIDLNELRSRKTTAFSNYYIGSGEGENETDEFNGILYTNGSDYNPTEIHLQLNKYTGVTGRPISKENLIKVHYLSPIDHMINDTFSRIIKNEKYKDICIKMLKIFDSNIEDLVLQKETSPYRTIEYVKNGVIGLMPISTYGDGIKKVLSIANAIALSANGILLIDEIDTSIHAKYYDDIFKFLLKASQEYNVQLFITTHSIEAVDGLLNTQVINSNYTHENDPINVITLRKDKESGKTLARSMSGHDVFENREKFNFEVRI